jgi:multisubunit Na+/H+ antiporter MnhB subunit
MVSNIFVHGEGGELINVRWFRMRNALTVVVVVVAAGYAIGDWERGGEDSV